MPEFASNWFFVVKLKMMVAYVNTVEGEKDTVQAVRVSGVKGSVITYDWEKVVLPDENV